MVQVSFDVGRMPASLTTTCVECAHRFHGWAAMNRLSARVVDVEPGRSYWSSAEAAEMAVGLAEAYESWSLVALGEAPDPDHFLSVPGASGA